jgi:hypothetical protein
MPISSKGAKRYFRLLPIVAATALKSARGQAWSFSFNVTDRCPIGCKCYWRAQARVKEMDDDAVVEFFHGMRGRGFTHATLIGGEPYVNPGLLERITPIMPANWIVTSGTTPLRWFPRTTHMISIDGQDAETHNRVRESAGLFERIEKHLAKAKNEWAGAFPAFAHCVLNALNFRQIDGILHYWSENRLLDGVVFSTGTAKLTQSFNAAGERIGQCVLSERADCSQCGCVITAIYSLYLRLPPLSSPTLSARSASPAISLRRIGNSRFSSRAILLP